MPYLISAKYYCPRDTSGCLTPCLSSRDPLNLDAQAFSISETIKIQPYAPCEKTIEKCCKVIFILSPGKFSDSLGFRGMGCAGLSYNDDITASRCPCTKLRETSRYVVERQKRTPFSSASC